MVISYASYSFEKRSCCKRWTLSTKPWVQSSVRGGTKERTIAPATDDTNKYKDTKTDTDDDTSTYQNNDKDTSRDKHTDNDIRRPKLEKK